VTDGYLAEPAGELVQHQAGGDAGRINRAARRAAALLRLVLWEKGCLVVLPTMCVGGREHADDFAQHATVGPEAAAALGAAPNGAAGRDRVDAAKHRIAKFVTGPVAVVDGFQRNGRVYVPGGADEDGLRAVTTNEVLIL